MVIELMMMHVTPSGPISKPTVATNIRIGLRRQPVSAMFKYDRFCP